MAWNSQTSVSQTSATTREIRGKSYFWVFFFLFFGRDLFRTSFVSYFGPKVVTFAIQPQTPPPSRSSPPLKCRFRGRFLVAFARFRPLLVKSGQNRLEIGTFCGQETKHVKRHVKIDRAHFRAHVREHWKFSREHWKISRGSLREDPLVRFTQTKPQPSWAFPGEIQKGTGGRGRDRKCHKLS